MKINVINCSSPGASFTNNTNSVLVRISDWIIENGKLTLPFREFRRKLETEKQINDNNARNIYPLLKNCGFVMYEPGALINTSEFFTRRGAAYVELLKGEKAIIESKEYSKAEKDAAIQKIRITLSLLVCQGLNDLLRVPDVNYKKPLQALMKYLLRYQKINKFEYAYLLYELNNDDFLENVEKNIELYRTNQIDIEVEVNVRNDTDIVEQTNTTRRNEGIDFLTSYTYFIGLLAQAGLVKKDGNYYSLNQNKVAEIRELSEE